jgi:hypothetical protein
MVKKSSPRFLLIYMSSAPLSSSLRNAIYISVCMYVFMYLWMDGCMLRFCLDGLCHYSYSLFGGLSVIGRWLVNMDSQAPKNRDPSDGPQKTKWRFLENSSNGLIKFHQFVETISLIKPA